MTGLPPPPPGFVLQGAPAGGGMPPPPPGFVLQGAKPAPDQGAGMAFQNELGQDLSFGLMDEAVAAGGATLAPLTNLIAPKPISGTWGERYDKLLNAERGRMAASHEQHPIASGLGDVGAVAVSGAPKAIAGAVGAVMRAPTAAERLINAGVGAGKGAAIGGAYGAATGFGEGEGGFVPRLDNAGRQAATGAAVGGALGGAGGAFAKVPVAPPAPNAVVAALDRQKIRMAQAMASDSHVAQQAGGAAKSIPYFGTRVVDAGKDTLTDFTARKGQIAADYGGGTAADVASAGGAAKDALTNWVGPLTEKAVTHTYDAVDALVNPAVTTPLNETAKIAANIVRRRTAATLPPGDAVNKIREAVLTPGGLTYYGIKDLRTHVRELMKTPSLVHGDMSDGELKQIYTGLTSDLRTAVENAGGAPARAAFDKANLLNAAVEKRRTELMRVLGVNPKNPASPEAVFSAIYRKAGSTSTADIATLTKIRKSMPPEAWDTVASGVVSHMGGSPQTGEVSLDKFFTEYNKMSAAGRQALFGNKPGLASSLDDLALIAGRGKQQAKWANPSGTAQAGGYLAAGAALLNPVLWPKIAAAAIGGHFLTRALTRPATVRSMAAWARVWNQVNGRGIGGPAQANIKSLQFVSRRFASEIGTQFGLSAAKVQALAGSLQGDAPAVASPDDQSQGN